MRSKDISTIKAAISLPIRVGDEILTGHWLNHKEKVKTIGEDKHGQPTVNNKPILRVRLPKLMSLTKKASGLYGWVIDGGEFVSVESHGRYIASRFPEEVTALGFDLTNEDDYLDIDISDVVELGLNQGWARVTSTDNELDIQVSSEVREDVINTVKQLAQDAVKAGDTVVLDYANDTVIAHNKLELGNVLRKLRTTYGSKEPTIFLGGECQTDWRDEVAAVVDGLNLIDPVDEDWIAEENIYQEVEDMLLADAVVFYKGGEGTEQEKALLDALDVPYTAVDDVADVITVLEDIQDASGGFDDEQDMAWVEIPGGTTVDLAGVPVRIALEADVTGEVPADDVGLIMQALNSTASKLQRTAGATHEKGCIHIPLPQAVADYFLKEVVGERVKPEALTEQEGTLYGVETTQHTTLLYGLDADLPVEDVRAALVGVLRKPLTIRTDTEISYFDNDARSVAIIRVDCPELHAAHEALKELLPNEQTYKEYTPHITLCYLKAGERITPGAVKAFEWQANTVVISEADNTQHMLQFSAERQRVEEI